jgi:peptidase E
MFATSMSALKLQRQCTAAIISSFTNAATNPVFLARISTVLASKESNKLVYIPTASYAPDRSSLKSVGEQRRRARYDAEQKMELIRSTLSLQTSAMLELDTAGTTPQKLTDQLSDADVIYVDGGNTFYLQRHMIETGFWDAALPAMEGGCLYIGASAGGIVAGKSIGTAYWKGWDDPRAAGETYDWNEERLCGANLCAGESFFYALRSRGAQGAGAAEERGVGRSETGGVCR